MKSNVKDFMIKKIQERNVLSQGDFALNSGQHSDYYYNFGQFNDSKALTELGFIIWSTMKQFEQRPEVVFGCAMKGITLALAASHYAFIFDETILPFAYDRKELKTHGEGGDYIGTNIQGKSVLILDDVLTTGKALQRSISIVEKYTHKIHCMVLLNRDPALHEVSGYPVVSIIDHQDVMKYFQHHQS